jgi:KAP family P-loop domain
VTSQQTPGPLAVAPVELNPEKPFDGDLFERRELAERLTPLLSRLPDGGVIAIDANWGEGKTWFGRNWCAQLKQRGFPTAYIDAFESDFVDDPFLLLAAEIRATFANSGEEVKRRFTERATAVGKVLLPAIAKGAARGLTKVIVGEAGTDEIVEALTALTDKAEEGLDKVIEDRLQELQKRKGTIDAFKKALVELARGSGQPVIVFVDELDRCRPTFAVQFIERTKHFFEVPNVVFVLLLNRRQLEAATRGIYGADLDANLYLSKFITLTISLPRRDAAEHGQDDFLKRYIRAVGKRLGYVHDGSFEEFVQALGGLAAINKLTARDIDRAMAYYGIAGRVGLGAPLVAYLILLRMRGPELFRAIRSGSREEHLVAMKAVNEQIRKFGGKPYPLHMMALAHRAAADGLGAISADEQTYLRGFSMAFDDNISRAFAHYAAALDLDVR